MPNQKNSTNGTSEQPTSISEKPKCGIIMPISAIDGLLPSHWEDVKSILREAIESAGFEADLVSETEESAIIQKTIVQNLYNNPIVVCDVSGKNPNVMFELGIRLTFDKPTVVVKDDQTDYSFDMSPIEHLGYPRDLRFNQIVQFQEKLASKVKATYDLALKDPNYSTFLKHFGQFIVPKLDQKELSPDQFIIKRLEDLTQSIASLERGARLPHRAQSARQLLLEFNVGEIPNEEIKKFFRSLKAKYHDFSWRRTSNVLEVFVPDSLHPDVVDQLSRRIVSGLFELETDEERTTGEEIPEENAS